MLGFGHGLQKGTAPAAQRRFLEGYEATWLNVVGIGGVHLLSLLALLPAFFSWSGIVLMAAGLFVFGVLGTNVGLHRLLTHRSFQCSKRLEHLLALLGICCLQDTPAWWVATHRQHHQHSDQPADPHSPLAAFLWGHMGWLLLRERGVNRHDVYERYARDVLQDPFYMGMERNLRYAWIYVCHCVAFLLVGTAFACLSGSNSAESLRFGMSLMVWGAFVRTVIVWHVTWSVNSLTHLWGYQPHATGDNSRNNLLVGYLAAGEGWHNNHHANQGSARHGKQWWELDVTYATICLLRQVGLVWQVKE